MQKKTIRRLAAVLQLRPQEEGEEFSAAVARVTNKHGVSPLSLRQSGGWLTRTERMSGGESGAESGRARLLGNARNARGSMPLRLATGAGSCFARAGYAWRVLLEAQGNAAVGRVLSTPKL